MCQRNLEEINLARSVNITLFDTLSKPGICFWGRSGQLCLYRRTGYSGSDANKWILRHTLRLVTTKAGIGSPHENNLGVLEFWQRKYTETRLTQLTKQVIFKRETRWQSMFASATDVELKKCCHCMKYLRGRMEMRGRCPMRSTDREKTTCRVGGQEPWTGNRKFSARTESDRETDQDRKADSKVLWNADWAAAHGRKRFILSTHWLNNTASIHLLFGIWSQQSSNIEQARRATRAILTCSAISSSAHDSFQATHTSSIRSISCSSSAGRRPSRYVATLALNAWREN